MSRTYSALVRNRSGLCVEEWRQAPGKATMRILLVGVCGTDLQILRQVRPDAARVLGHEGLAEATSEAGGVRHVVFNPVDESDQDRILGHSYDGLLRQVVPAGEASRLFEVDPALPADLAVLIEPLAAVLYGWQLMTTATSLRTLGIWGAGTTAVLTALVAEVHGVAARLYHDRPARLRYLRSLNVVPAATLAGMRAADHVDAAALCVAREGTRDALAQAVTSVRPGGVVDLFGGFTGGDRHPSVPDVDLGTVRRANACGNPDPGRTFAVRTVSGREILLVGHRGTADRHFHAAQRMLLDHRERFGRLLTHIISLPRAAALLPRFANTTGRADPDRDPHLKVVVDLGLSADRRTPRLDRTVGDLAAGR